MSRLPRGVGGTRTATRIARRGEVYSIDPNPAAGRELRDRHFWLVLTEEEVNRHGMTIAVAINTAAEGMRAAGLAVNVSAGPVTGVAILNQIRSFDLRARGEATGVRYVDTVDPVVVADVASRVASLIDPEPPAPKKGGQKGQALIAPAAEKSALAAALKKAQVKRET